MKRATVKLVKASAKSGDLAHEFARDILDSDARQRARIRDLKARLKAVEKWYGYLDPKGVRAVTDLKNKKWRKP